MDDLIVKFCEDRRSWLFVIAGTLGVCLVFALPCVDEYLAVCDEQAAVSDQLALAQESALLVEGYEARRAEQVGKVDAQLDKTLHQGNEADYRNAVVKMVRDAGCQLRRLNVGSPQTRAWHSGDEPLNTSPDDTKPATAFKLERRQVNLSLVGSSASVRGLIERFEKYDKQVHVESIDLKPIGGDGRQVELTMNLWYFTLSRPAA